MDHGDFEVRLSSLEHGLDSLRREFLAFKKEILEGNAGNFGALMKIVGILDRRQKALAGLIEGKSVSMNGQPADNAPAEPQSGP